MDIKKILMKARPDLSETSAEHYEKTIRNLNKEMRDSKKIKSFAWLKNHEKILEHLSGKKSYLSQRNYLNAIIVALDSGGASDELLKKFSDKRDEHNNRYVEERRNNVSFGNQEQNMITREELDKVLEKQEKFVKLFGCKKGDDVTIKEYNQFQIYAVLRFYQKYALRNDFPTFVYMTAKDFNELDEEDQNINVYLHDVGKIIINKYKTAKVRGQVNIDLDKRLNTILRCLIRQREKIGFAKDNNYLIVKQRNGEPFTKKQFSNYLQNFFYTKIKKKIGSTLLRRIYLSKYSEVKEEMKKDAQIMGHSVGTQQGVYVGKSG